MSKDAEMRKPILEQFDAYGNRVDTIHTTEGWKYFKKQAAIERLISLPYELEGEKDMKNKSLNRLHQVIKLYLFNPSSGMFSCPLAMTDGAAFTLREMRRQRVKYWNVELELAFASLVSNDPDKFWTSG